MIGLHPDSTVVESIVEIANRNGLATGVISTSSVTHATPASFVAHNISRNNYEEIAVDFTKGKIDLFMGGGLNNFTSRADSADLTVKLKEMGYSVVTNPEELAGITSGKLAGLFYPGHMPKASEGRSISLSLMTRKALEILSKNENGFFLMVEASMIDWAGHDGDTDYNVSETLDLDEAVGEALAFALKSGNTLVVVTADHETGGMALTGGNLRERKVSATFATSNHTATMVPVFSSGPGAEKFGGVMENTEIFERMIMALGIK
jgi:alkaline phosphatase